MKKREKNSQSTICCACSGWIDIQIKRFLLDRFFYMPDSFKNTFTSFINVSKLGGQSL